MPSSPDDVHSHFDPELTAAVAEATRAAWARLRGEHGGPFCAIALLTTGEALRPYLSVTLHGPERWDLPDSPFAVWADDLFASLDPLWSARGDITAIPEPERDREYALRLGSMEEALRQLDTEGVFGAGVERENVLLLVSPMPPDSSDAGFARRLNRPSLLFDAWLVEAAEGV